MADERMFEDEPVKMADTLTPAPELDANMPVHPYHAAIEAGAKVLRQFIDTNLELYTDKEIAWFVYCSMNAARTIDDAPDARPDVVEQLRAERDALLQKPIDLAKMDSIDEDASGKMVAYYWWQQAQDARGVLSQPTREVEAMREAGFDVAIATIERWAAGFFGGDTRGKFEALARDLKRQKVELLAPEERSE